MTNDSFKDQKKLLDGIAVRAVFDVGAHCGDVTQTYLGLFENATIYAFEPYEASYLEMAQRFDSNPRVLSFQTALDVEVSSRPLYIYSNTSASSFSKLSSYSIQNPLNPEKCKLVMTVSVETMTIDAFCGLRHIDAIDLLKLDVQGAELNILMGAKNMISNKKIGIVYTELQYQRLYEEACMYYEVAEFLGCHGFKLYGLYNMVSGHDGLARHGDGIFISENLYENIDV